MFEHCGRRTDGRRTDDGRRCYEMDKTSISMVEIREPGGQLWANTAFEGSQFYSIGVPKFYSWVNIISVYVYNELEFGGRLRSYLDKWINMAKIENTFEAICDFMARDQFLESCCRELYVHLKPKTFKNLDEMAKEADLFAEARGGVHMCMNKGQRDNRGAAQNHSKPDVNKGGRKQEIKCGICGKGHLTIKCYKNPNRMQASSAEVGNQAEGGDSDAKNEMQGAQARSDSFQNKGRGNSFGRGRNFPRGRGRGGNPPRGGGHQVNFCKTQIEERSENGIENICQSKGDNSINSMTKDKEGVCYFLKSRLPTACGTERKRGDRDARHRVYRVCYLEQFGF